MRVVIIGKGNGTFDAFKACLLGEPQVKEVRETKDAATALKWIGEGQVDTVVADKALDHMSGLAFIEEVVRKNPMVQTALVSSGSRADFHEATEGLGVLMQLCENPSSAEAEQLVGKINKINGLFEPDVARRS